MKLPKLNLKIIIPVFIMVIFISSTFVVFASGGVKTQKAKLIVDFGQPGMLYSQDVALSANMTAIEILSAHAQSLELQGKQVKCIVNYCNTNVTQWYFHLMQNSQLGQQEIDPGVAPTDYVVQNNDIIVFRYMMITNSTASAPMINASNGTA